MWFIDKYKKRIAEMEQNNRMLANRISLLNRQLLEKNNIPKDNLMAALMRESLGLSIDFSAANDKCLPLHFLDGMQDAERHNFVNHMETIYNDDKFQKVVKYMINLFATNAIYKYDREEMKNGQIAVVAFRTFLNQLEKMHLEFTSYKSKDEEFDEQGILPE